MAQHSHGAPDQRLGTGPEARSTEGDTRRAVLLILLRKGPVTASEIGSELGLSAAGVRRHLDNLTVEGTVTIAQRRPHSQGRGRPAKAFKLTDKGREAFGHGYDALAAQALHTLRETGGDEAVRAFARKRIQGIVQTVEENLPPDPDPLERAEALAQALTENGYAAEVRQTSAGVQICQHHCPISQVAHEFPELCQAEHQAIAEIFGSHIQPLASIAHGNGVCTTNVPVALPMPTAPPAKDAPPTGDPPPGAPHAVGPAG